MSNKLTKYTSETVAPDRGHFVIYVCAYFRKEEKDSVFNRIWRSLLITMNFFVFFKEMRERNSNVVEVLMSFYNISFKKLYAILPDFIKYFFFFMLVN